jgi:hypothetical protein
MNNLKIIIIVIPTSNPWTIPTSKKFLHYHKPCPKKNEKVKKFITNVIEGFSWWISTI